jgi:hypothetical protein
VLLEISLQQAGTRWKRAGFYRDAGGFERQTAIAEILWVISSSPTDVQPTLTQSPAPRETLSGAANGSVFRSMAR